MTDFAIVRKGQHQYALRSGEYLDMPRIEGKEEAKISFDEVLLTYVKGKTNIGQPVVKDAKVECTILKQFKGPKMKAGKFKAKSRYRKSWGYREQLTRVRVDKIVVK